MRSASGSPLASVYARIIAARHGVALHHVGLRAHLLAERVTGVRDAAEAGVHRHPAAAVDQRDLPDGLARVVGDQLLERRRGALALAHELEPARPEGRLGDRLRGHRAHAGLRPAHDRADAEEVRLDRHAELPARRVSCDDGVGQSGEATRAAGSTEITRPRRPGGELHRAGPGGEDRVVLADAHAVAGLEAGAALAHDDLAAGDRLAGEHLHAEALRVGVAAVTARSESLLMSHPLPPSSPRPCVLPP